MSDLTVDIAGLDKGALLLALYNRARPVGLGHWAAAAGGALDLKAARRMVDEAAERGIRLGQIYFDYLNGRPLKCNLAGDVLATWLFDRDHGQGSAAAAVAELRARSFGE